MSEYTQEEKILHFVRQEPDRIWFAKDFQNGEKFVGYEAGPRICGLVQQGYMECVGWFDKDGRADGAKKFKGYKLVINPDIQARPKKTPKSEIDTTLPPDPIFSEIVYMKPHAKAVQVTGTNYYGEYFTYLDGGKIKHLAFRDVMFRKLPND